MKYAENQFLFIAFIFCFIILGFIVMLVKQFKNPFLKLFLLKANIMIDLN